MLYHLALDREPQSHIAALSMINAFGSRVIIKLLSAFNITEIAIFVRIRLLVELFPLTIPMPYTKTNTVVSVYIKAFYRKMIGNTCIFKILV